MKKLSNTEAELKKNVAYKKSVYSVMTAVYLGIFRDIQAYSIMIAVLYPDVFSYRWIGMGPQKLRTRARFVKRPCWKCILSQLKYFSSYRVATYNGMLKKTLG